VLEVVFGKSIQPLTLEFLQLLTEKGREEILPQIIDKFLQLRDIRLGTVGVDVKTAIELSKEQISQLEKWFEIYTKKKIRFNFSLDKQLIGGIVARVDDTMFNGSVKRQLELIRQRLIEEVDLQ
jgi:F-type H+-transporting ATPase subunit delta